MSGEPRYVWRIAFRNFINSLRPKQIRGNHIGSDYIGNKYFEIPADPSIGKRKPQRWYDPAKGLDFEDPIPPEWESWLRARRAVPPTEEEIQKNLALAKTKKENAAKLEAERLGQVQALAHPTERGPRSFPKYPDLAPGDPEAGTNKF